MTFYILQLVSLLGGLALFLYGMDVMGKSLERLAGSKLQNILEKMSSNIIKGFILGIGVTAIIQSSSATTVMVVGFVNSGIMTLRQAIGIIMGSNVGTTITAWILSLTALEGDSFIVQLFKPSTLSPLMGIVGIVLYMFTSDRQKQGVGTIFLGFMALMTGMSLMSDSMSFLKSEQWFANLMVSFSNPILGILAGAVLTAIIQSSSASVGILQGLCATGAVSFGTAIPIILGQNIGTCVTAMLSTVGANRGARRTALVHLYFNLVGVALFCVVFYGLDAFIPWHFLAETVNAVDIAVVHTGFNVGATLVLLPMNRLLEKLAYMTIPAEEIHQEPVLLDERLLATPGVAVSRSYQVIGDMLFAANEAMRLTIELLRDYSDEKFEKVVELEKETDNYEDTIGSYLLKLTGVPLSAHDNRSLNAMLHTLNDIERIADHALILAKSFKKMKNNNIKFSDVAMEELEVLEKAIEHIVESTAKAFTENDIDRASKIEPQLQVIETLVKEIKNRHIQRLQKGQCSVEYGIILEDLLTSYLRCADHCSNIGVEMLQLAEDKMEAHEYISALRSGDLEESAQFSERIDDYSQRYSMPE